MEAIKEKEVKEETIEIPVNLPQIMQVCVDQMRDFTIGMAFQITDCRMRSIAKRALEIKDEVIMKELVNLGYLQKKGE